MKSKVKMLNILEKFVTKHVFSEINCFYIYIYNRVFFRKYDLIYSWSADIS